MPAPRTTWLMDYGLHAGKWRWNTSSKRVLADRASASDIDLTMGSPFSLSRVGIRCDEKKASPIASTSMRVWKPLSRGFLNCVTIGAPSGVSENERPSGAFR